MRKYNVAITAVARELACFTWGLMTEHIICWISIAVISVVHTDIHPSSLFHQASFKGIWNEHLDTGSSSHLRMVHVYTDIIMIHAFRWQGSRQKLLTCGWIHPDTRVTEWPMPWEYRLRIFQKIFEILFYFGHYITVLHIYSSLPVISFDDCINFRIILIWISRRNAIML